MKNLLSITTVLIVLTCLISLGTFAQGVGVNATGASADSSAILDVSSTDQGFLPPRMTTAERDAISNPATGLIIYNLDTDCINMYTSGGSWMVLCGAPPCSGPDAPVSTGHSPQQTDITWNWNTVSGALGYKYNTVNDYASATDNGAVTSYAQTGLTCGTSNTLYVWAYNACGESTATAFSESTLACFLCGTNTVTFTYNGATVTYGTVSSNGECWLDRNLGASNVATSSTNASGYGDLFQWGRLDDGHQLRTSSTTTTLSNSDVPGHSDFILNSTAPSDWRNPQNDNLWQGVNGTNNPCPSGWRIPTEAEWTAEMLSWSSQNNGGAMASPLRLPNSGTRNGSHGGLLSVGNEASYWCSDISGTKAKRFTHYGSGAGVTTNNRTYGWTIRCIKD